MPGIVGFTTSSFPSLIDKSNLIKRLSESISNSENHNIQINIIPEVQIGVVSFDFQSESSSFFENSSLSLWIYGDPVYEEVTRALAIEKLAKSIIAEYPSLAFLKDVDGLFNVVIYDKHRKKLYLTADRNGLSHLYYGVFGSELYWSSELRAFLSDNFDLHIREASIQSFLALGYQIKDSTWFEEINLLPPASYLIWDIDTCEYKINKYWDHMEHSVEMAHHDEQEIISDLAYLFKQAVAKRFKQNEKVGITLSGGLDSRAIFAAAPDNCKNFTTITRGIEGCGDIILARQVVSHRPDVNQVIAHMNEENWLNGRFDAIQSTSGQKSLIHMNSISSLHLHKDYFDINLDGAGGGGIFGGDYTKHIKPSKAKDHLKRKFIRTDFPFNDEVIEELYKYYVEINSPEYFHIYQRLRRFIVFGSILGHDYGIISRFPYLDNKLVDYFLSIPPNFDRESLFRKMLINEYETYFKKINSTRNGRKLYSNSHLDYLLRGIFYIEDKIGISKYRRSYTDYPMWLKGGEALPMINEIKRGIKNNRLSQYIDSCLIEKKIDHFLNSGEGIEEVSRIITMYHYFRESDK